MDPKTAFSSDIVPIDSGTSRGLRKLPLELRDMVYDGIHQEEEAKTVGKQLIARYALSPALFQRVGKEFAQEINRRLPRNQIHKLEITQKKLIFLPKDESHDLPERMLPHGPNATVLAMNFNINECPQVALRKIAHDLLQWIEGLTKHWDENRE